jgi:PIN domain nuclease of toxin-antitoxin system
VNLLLDTHVVLWSLGAPEKLGSKLRTALENPDNTVFVSAVSAWEIEIKRALGKLRAPHDLEVQLRAVRFTELGLRFRHVQELGRLPDLHRDPFDRMLIAQARVEDLTLVTHDKRIRSYEVETLGV